MAERIAINELRTVLRHEGGVLFWRVTRGKLWESSMNTASMTTEQMADWEAANTHLDDSHLLADDFDAESIVEAIPMMWLAAIPCPHSNGEEPIDIAFFSKLRGDEIKAFANACNDSELLLTLALNMPEQWGVVALNRVRDLVRAGDDYRRWIGIVEERAGVAA